MSLIVYGHPASQPSRSVLWTCLLGGISCKLAIGKRSDDLGLLTEGSPREMIPWIQDGNFELAESGAIIWYLARKYGLTQLFPEDIREQARVHQYVHMHQSLVRLSTYHLMTTHVVKPLPWRPSKPSPFSKFERMAIRESYSKEDNYTEGGKIVSLVSGLLEDRYFFNDSTFLCGGPQATAADIMCYAEIGQFVFANLFDFSDYPKLTRWLAAMREIPFHDVIHTYNIELGDIRTTPNTFDRYWDATEKCVGAMIETGLVTLAELNRPEFSGDSIS